MAREVDPRHPIRSFFSEALHLSLHRDLGLPETEDVDAYIVDMLLRFLDWEGLYAVRDAHGMPVETLAGMLMEGDVRLNADSFAREREVHRHIGDFLLFWSGMFPEFLGRIRIQRAADVIDLTKQGQYSYHVVSTFEHPPYDGEAPVFKVLSAEFEAYQMGLRRVRSNFPGLGPWVEGFSA